MRTWRAELIPPIESTDASRRCRATSGARYFNCARGSSKSYFGWISVRLAEGSNSRTARYAGARCRYADSVRSSSPSPAKKRVRLAG